MVSLRAPTFLVTENDGTHEFSRVYVFSGGRCKAGDRYDAKIGPAVVSEVHYDEVRGLRLVTSRGTMHVGSASCYATWLSA